MVTRRKKATTTKKATPAKRATPASRKKKTGVYGSEIAAYNAGYKRGFKTAKAQERY